MLCSKLHCPKGFNLIPSSYRTSEPPAVRPACPKRSKVTRKQRPARSVNRGKKRENSLGAASNYKIPGPELAWVVCRTSSSSLLISSPELNDTNVSEPYIRALLGTAEREGAAAAKMLGFRASFMSRVSGLGFRTVNIGCWQNVSAQLLHQHDAAHKALGSRVTERTKWCLPLYNDFVCIYIYTYRYEYIEICIYIYI